MGTTRVLIINCYVNAE